MSQLKGLIHHIGPTQKVNDNFSKREFILITEHDTQFPQYITLACNNAKIALLNNVKEGDLVVVDININGKLTKNDNTKAFNNLVAYQINKA